MGTNFYWAGVNVRYSTDPKIHIGKRSAAGMYCWDCMQILCKGGKSKIHYDYGFYDECPRCGQKRNTKGINRGAAIELGFAKSRTTRSTGVQGCSSFSWAQEPSKVRKRCLKLSSRWRKIIVDEYGRKMTGRQFIEMLDNNCPVQYEYIGQEFS